MNVSILGGGAYGLALAVNLAKKKNFKVTVWEFFTEVAEKLQSTRTSGALPGIILDSDIQVTSDLNLAINESEVVLVALPSEKVEEIMIKIKDLISNQKILIGSKGFASEHRLLSEVVKSVLPNNETYYFSGPTIALELAKGGVCGMVLAGNKVNKETLEILSSPSIRVERTGDWVGCQVGAALKNVINIYIGISEGLFMGENTKAYLFTKGIEEIAEIGVKIGAKKETFYGLTCMGDLTLRSRNRNLGSELAKGKSTEQIKSESGQTLEGVKALDHALYFIQKFSLKSPIIESLDRIINSGVNPSEEIASIYSV